MIYPDGADGNVLMRLEERGFYFSKKAIIDFNVDFKSWHPSKEAVALLSAKYPSVKIYEQEDEHSGYLQFQIFDFLAYNLVTTTQDYVTELMQPFRGECVSWGVMH